MNSVIGLNYFVFCILVLILVLFFTMDVRNEGFNSISQSENFGMSPGTLDQLSSTRAGFEDINRKPNQDVTDMIQANLLKQGLNDMTGIEAYEEKDAIFAKLYENLNYIK